MNLVDFLCFLWYLTGMMECFLVGYLFICPMGVDRSPSNIKDYYPNGGTYSLFDGYNEGKKIVDQRQKSNPLFAPPDNLSQGDNGEILLKKLMMNRVSIFQNEARKTSPAVNDAATTIEKATGREMVVSPKGMCDIKVQLNYDVNQNTVAMKSVCESYNFRSIYSVFTNTYDVSLYKQYTNENKIGLKSTKPSENILVFLEGSW